MFSTTVHVLAQFPFIYLISRLEMAELGGSPGIERITITTNPNTAYEVVKQHGQGGRIEDDYEVVAGAPLLIHITHHLLPISSSQPCHALWSHPHQVIWGRQERQRECM